MPTVRGVGQHVRDLQAAVDPVDGRHRDPVETRHFPSTDPVTDRPHEWPGVPAGPGEKRRHPYGFGSGLNADRGGVAERVAGRVEAVTVDCVGDTVGLGDACGHTSRAGADRSGPQPRHTQRRQGCVHHVGGWGEGVVEHVPHKLIIEGHGDHTEGGQRHLGNLSGDEHGAGLKAHPETAAMGGAWPTADVGGPVVAAQPQLGPVDVGAHSDDQVSRRRPRRTAGDRRNPLRVARLRPEVRGSGRDIARRLWHADMWCGS